MESLSQTICKTVNDSIISTVNNYIREFSSKLVKEVNSSKKKEWKEEDFVDIWNTVAKEFIFKKSSKKGKSEEVVVEENCQCHHVYGKGDMKDKKCQERISEKSETKKFCVRHYKGGDKVSSKVSDDGKENHEKGCCHIRTKGENEGQECGVKVSSKSESGKFCSKHASLNEKEKKSSEKKEKKSSEKKEKKSSEKKEKKSSEKKETTEDEEKKETTEDEEKWIGKSLYADGKKLPPASPRRTMKNIVDTNEETNEDEEIIEDEDEEELLPIIAKRFKSGKYKGEAYFTDSESNTVFMLNVNDQSVSHKVINDEKVVIDDSDKIRIERYGLQCC